MTNSIDNDSKKSGILKSTRNSIKRKVQNFSTESDDAVIEPLLQKDKDKPDLSKCAKITPKSKTESFKQNGKDESKYYNRNSGMDEKAQLIADEDQDNTNVGKKTCSDVSFSDKLIANISKATTFQPKTLIGHIVSIKEGTTLQPYQALSPLIFTTAKIHDETQGKEKELIILNKLPIVSTTEINKVKPDDIKDGNVMPTNCPSILENKSNSALVDIGVLQKSTIPVSSEQNKKSLDIMIDSNVNMIKKSTPLSSKGILTHSMSTKSEKDTFITSSSSAARAKLPQSVTAKTSVIKKYSNENTMENKKQFVKDIYKKESDTKLIDNKNKGDSISTTQSIDKVKSELKNTTSSVQPSTSKLHSTPKENIITNSTIAKPNNCTTTTKIISNINKSKDAVTKSDKVNVPSTSKEKSQNVGTKLEKTKSLVRQKNTTEEIAHPNNETLGPINNVSKDKVTVNTNNTDKNKQSIRKESNATTSNKISTNDIPTTAPEIKIKVKPDLSGQNN